MNQTSKLMDLIYGVMDFLLECVTQGVGSTTTLAVLAIVIVVLLIIGFILNVIEDSAYYESLDDNDIIENEYDEEEMLLPCHESIRQKVKFSNKGYICYFDNCIRLLHNGVFVTKDLVDITDIQLSDDNYMIISHDGYEETVNGVKVSYVTYRFIRNEILESVAG